MQTGCFAAAWQDIRNSPGWVGKLLVLGLVSLIPVFGWIVVLGYLYGWARDIAWDLHAPLPARVFGNEDGRLYSRGSFALIIGLVCMLAPWVLELAWGVMTGVGVGWFGHGRGPLIAFFGMGSLLFSLLVLAVALIALAFAGVGAIRMSIYGRLAAGLQLGRIWAMIRHDASGLARILGMAILLSLGMGVALWAAGMVLALVGVLVGFAVGIPFVHTNSLAVLLGAAPGLVLLVILLSLVCGVLAMTASVFICMMTVRALGYWTRQFDVPAWRGQDDPMPFELVGGPPAGQPPMQG